MTNHVVQVGNTYTITNIQDMIVKPNLDVGTYSVNFDIQKGYYLSKIDDLVVSGKLYGDIERRTHRVLSTFVDRPSTTGLLLKGEKGSGKTLLARNICQEARKINVPTLVVNAPFCGEGFNNFISGIEQECIVMFDEFEKVYEPNKQQLLLTLFDGLYKTKKLFIVTVNDYSKMDFAMRNRPGRLYYSFNYKGLSEEFIREYCEDVLKDKSQIETVIMFAGRFNSFNFDMLKAVVEEMNRYDEKLIEVIQYLNTESSGETFIYDVKSLTLKNGEEALKVSPNPCHGRNIDLFNPNGFFVLYDTERTLGNEDRECEYFYSYDFVSADNTGNLTFENKNATLVIAKKTNGKESIDALMGTLTMSMPIAMSKA